MGKWCGHCQDHFSESHYDDDGFHKVGAEYGPTGEAGAIKEAFDDLLDLAEELHEKVTREWGENPEHEALMARFRAVKGI